MKRVLQISSIILLLLFTITVGAAIGAHFFFKKHEDVIFSGVSVEGYDFSGLTKKEAEKRLKELTAPFLDKSIVLEGRKKSWLLELAKINFNFKGQQVLNKAFAVGRKGNLLQRSREVWETAKYGRNLDLKISYDQKKLKEELVKISQEVDKEFRNAHINLKTGQIVEAQKGHKLNIKKSEEKIVSKLSRLEASSIQLVIEDREYRVNQQQLRKLDLNNQLSTYVTEFDPAEKNRVQNIKLASEKINGTLLKPGETFSFNKIVGPRTLEAGFKKAVEIVNQEFVTGVGGGVCQVSSVLYNAVLLGDFEVLDRQNHSRPVSYVPLGRGATVYYDYLDFKFKNDSSTPIMVLSTINENELRISIMGSSKDYRVQIVTGEPEVFEYERKKKVDSDLKDGQQKIIKEGKNGYQIVVKKRILINDRVVEEKIVSEDIYPPVDEVIKVSDK